MSRLAWMTIPLVALALAGCVGGNDAQIPTALGGSRSSTASGTGSAGNATGNATGNSTPLGPDPITLSVDPMHGSAPTNVTLRYDVANASADLTWTLTMQRTGEASAEPATNETGNATGGAGGNSTGNSTGNATGNSTSATTTSASPSGNATGNSTGNSTGNATGNGTATDSGNATASNGTATPTGTNATFVLSINGTAADLPGLTVQRLNVSGTYSVVFHVDFGNGSTADRNATVSLLGPQPGDALGNETLHKTGLIVLGGTEADCDGIGSVDVPWVLNATHNGTAGEITAIHATLHGSTGAIDLDLSLIGPNGTAIANSTFGSNESIDVPGPLEAGNYTLHIAACAAVAGSWTLDASASYVVAGPAGSSSGKA